MCMVESEDAQVLTDLSATFTVSCEQAAVTLIVSIPVFQHDHDKNNNMLFVFASFITCVMKFEMESIEM